MCGTCGCGEGEIRIESGHAHPAQGKAHGHDHQLSHDQLHALGIPHEHSHGGGAAHSHAHPHSHDNHHDHVHVHEAPPSLFRRSRLVQVEADILARNNLAAAANRRRFATSRTLALNLVSSPGSGKTSLLVETLKRLAGRIPAAVIEGDQETSADADRIRATGTPAVQINTGKGCHLEADVVGTAIDRLPAAGEGILFIENVGNLVCPAGFDLGEAHKVVIVSVTEGEDKPLKYPNMFAASDLMVVTKTDLLPHLDFDVGKLVDNARRIKPSIGVLQVSVRTGDGMDAWIKWLEAARAFRLAAM